MPNTAKISEKIKFIRRIRNLKQSDMAEKMGISHRHYQTIESGDKDFKISFLAKLSEALNVPSCYFIYPVEQRLAQVGIHCHSEVLDILSYPIMIANPIGEIIYQNKSFKQIFGIDKKRVCELGLDIHHQSLVNSFLSSPSKEQAIAFNSNIQYRIEIKQIKQNHYASASGFIFIFN